MIAFWANRAARTRKRPVLVRISTKARQEDVTGGRGCADTPVAGTRLWIRLPNRGCTIRQIGRKSPPMALRSRKPTRATAGLPPCAQVGEDRERRPPRNPPSRLPRVPICGQPPGRWPGQWRPLNANRGPTRGRKWPKLIIASPSPRRSEQVCGADLAVRKRAGRPPRQRQASPLPHDHFRRKTARLVRSRRTAASLPAPSVRAVRYIIAVVHDRAACRAAGKEEFLPKRESSRPVKAMC